MIKCEYCNSEITSDDLNCPFCYSHNEKYYKKYSCNGKILELISIKGNELNHSLLCISKQFYEKNLFKKRDIKFILVKNLKYIFIIFEIFILLYLLKLLGVLK